MVPGGTVDLDAFITWLATRPDVPAGHHKAYRQGAERITVLAGPGGRLLPKHVDEAVRRAEVAGATPQQLANLQRIGNTLMDYARTLPSAARPASVPPPAMSAPIAAPGDPPLALDAVPGQKPAAFMPGSSFRTPAIAEAGVAAGSGLCPSCGGHCYVDYWQGLGKKLGLVAGILACASIFLCGCLGAAAVSSFLAGAMFLVGGVVLSIKCTHCGTKLTPDQASGADRQEALSTRMKLLGGGIGLIIVSAVLSVATIMIGVALLESTGGMPATDPNDVLPQPDPPGGGRFVPEDQLGPRPPPNPWGR